MQAPKDPQESKKAEEDGDEDDKGDEWPMKVGEQLLVVSNAVPLGHMDTAPPSRPRAR